MNESATATHVAPLTRGSGSGVGVVGQTTYPDPLPQVVGQGRWSTGLDTLDLQLKAAV